MEHQLRQSMLNHALKGHIYGWLATDAWRCSKDELIAIAKEIAYTLGECSSRSMDERDACECLADNLEDALSDDEEDE